LEEEETEGVEATTGVVGVAVVATAGVTVTGMEADSRRRRSSDDDDDGVETGWRKQMKLQ